MCLLRFKGFTNPANHVPCNRLTVDWHRHSDPAGVLKPRATGSNDSSDERMSLALAKGSRPIAGFGTATTDIPAARAASTPEGASSRTRHRLGSAPRRFAAIKKDVRSGFATLQIGIVCEHDALNRGPTLLIVVGLVWLSFRETSSEESPVAGALMGPAILVTSAMIGVVLGVIGIVLAAVAMTRKERPRLVLIAWVANLPILNLSGVVLLRNYGSR